MTALVQSVSSEPTQATTVNESLVQIIPDRRKGKQNKEFSFTTTIYAFSRMICCATMSRIVLIIVSL